MKKQINILFAAVIVLSLTGCFDDPGTDILLDENEVSIADASEVGKNERRIVVDLDGQPTAETIDIQLIGPALNQDVTVTVAVNEAESSAIEGVDFEIPNKTVTIPAGSYEVPLVIDVNDDVLDPDNPLSLTLDIADASIDVNENYNSLTLSLIGVCPFDFTTLEGIYTVTSNGESTDDCPANNPLVNFDYTGVELTILADEANTITFGLSEAFGGMYIEWYGACYGYTFETDAEMVINKTSGVITIDASSAFNGDNFTINGAVDVCLLEDFEFSTSWTNAFGDTGNNVYVKQ